MTRRLILIHGTFAADSAWCRAGSAFVQRLTAEATSVAEVISFRWSGANDFRARHDAALALREVIRSGAPVDEQFIIAHSHGGNIAYDALQDPEIAGKVQGTVCLSTPFLHVRRREWSAAASLAVVLAAFAAPFFALGWISSLCCVSWADAHPNVFGTAAVALLVGFYSAIGAAGRHVAARLQPLEQLASDRRPVQTRMLIVRLATDEAGAVLSVAQFISWVVSRLFAPVDRLAGRASRLALLYYVALTMTLGALVYIEELYGWFTGRGSWLGSLISSPEILQFGSLLLIPVLVLAAFTVGVAAVLAVTATAFGLDALLGAFQYDISVEGCPPGEWPVHLLPADVQPMHGSGTLSHSSYEDGRAVELIRGWLAGAS
jgi:hypothetical protein